MQLELQKVIVGRLEASNIHLQTMEQNKSVTLWLHLSHRIWMNMEPPPFVDEKLRPAPSSQFHTISVTQKPNSHRKLDVTSTTCRSTPDLRMEIVSWTASVRATDDHRLSPDVVGLEDWPMEPGELWRSSCDVWVMGKDIYIYIYVYINIYQHHQRGANSIPESKGPKGVPIWHPYRSSCLYNDVWAHICVSSPLITGFSPSSLCAGHTATGCRGLLSFPHRGAKWSGCGMVVCYPFIHRQQT